MGILEVRWEKKYHMKGLLGNCNAKVGGERIFSIRQLGMRVFIGVVMVMLLE